MRSPAPLRSALLGVLFGLFVVACGAAGADGPEGVDDLGGDPAAHDVASATTTDGTGGESAFGDAIGDIGEVDGPLVAADDIDMDVELPEITSLASHAQVRATANVNLRKGPSTSYAVLAVIPAGTVLAVASTTSSNGFLNVTYNGMTGWSSAAYLASAATSAMKSPMDIDGPPSPDNTIARARTAVGFSYWWGGGVWLPSGATSSNAGSCSGSCPSCTHSGRYGADCSGLVAKAWQFGKKAIDENSHPYSTLDFVKSRSGGWSIINRSSIERGDALVYNENGAGHIVIFEKGDAWGAATVYECRGCAYGCTYNTRNFTSNYKAIRRAGF